MASSDIAAKMNAPARASVITIRETTSEDLEEVLYHRRQMFLDMGHAETVVDRIVESSRPSIQCYLADGSIGAGLQSLSRDELQEASAF